MFKRRNILIILSFCSLLLFGCGMSTIVVKNANVDLYVNNVYRGKGSVEVRRTGFPKRLYIEAKYNGATVGQLTVKRKLTGIGCLTGYFTYGLGLLFSFRYPETIIVPINETPNEPNPWKESIWKKPPKSWK